MEIFSKRLMELIGDKNIFWLSKTLDIPHQTLYRYVHFKRTPDIGILVKLADYFDVSIDYLIGRTYN
jgi:transcriptional regulator with XRE-family HTH domain